MHTRVVESGIAVLGIGVIPAPPESVWPVVRECGELVRFMPRLASSVEVGREGDASVCRTVVDVPFPFPNLTSDVLAVENELPGGGFRSSWSLVTGDFEQNQGAWTVLPWPERTEHSLLLHQNEVRPKTILPDFILRRLHGEMLRDAFGGVRRRVEERRNAELAGEPSAVDAGP